VLRLLYFCYLTACPLWPRSLVWEEFFEKLKKNNQWHVEVY